MKSLIVLAAATLAVSVARADILDLAQVQMQILPHEIGRFQVRAECAPEGGASSACRALADAAPTLTFRLRNQPTGLDDGDRAALRVSPIPMTAVLGAPITRAAAAALLGGEICGRRIFETDATDQFGGVWALTPIMHQTGGVWIHRWTVTPEFAGYRISVVGWRRKVEVVQTREQLEKDRGPGPGLLERFFSKSLF
jgi:hypothetical protein